MAYQQQPPYGQQSPYGQQYGQQFGQQQPGGYGYPNNAGGPAPPPGFMPPPGVGVPPMGTYHAPQYGDPEEGPKASVGFSDASIRAGFVRKVFLLVTVMLAVVTVMTAAPFFHTGLQTFVRQNIALYYVSYGVFMVVYIALMCCESVRRSFPSNLIFTSILTLAIGFMTMMICSMYKPDIVLLALIITTVVCGSVILFSTQTKYDLTSLIGFAFIAGMVLMVFGIVAVVASVAFHVRWLYTIYAGLAALLFLVYLAIDIQMIMGGKKYSIDPEEHIFAAIQVFLDIVMFFWMLLALIGGGSRD